MSFPPPVPLRTGDARAVRIGAVGGSVSVALFVLALLAFVVLVAMLFGTVTSPPDGSGTVITVVVYGLSVLGLVVLPSPATSRHPERSPGPCTPASSPRERRVRWSCSCAPA